MASLPAPPPAGGDLESHLPLLEREARRFAARSGGRVSPAELRGLAAEGLLEAARRFDPGRGIPFHAFARLRMRWTMAEGMRAQEPEPASLARAGRTRAHRPADATRAARERHALRLHAALAGGLLPRSVCDDEGSVVALAADPDPEAATWQAQRRRLLWGAVAGLPADERALVERHLLGAEPLGDVARALGVRPARASVLLERARRRLARELRGAGAWG